MTARICRARLGARVIAAQALCWKTSFLRGYVMSHKHESLLRSIFAGPASGNVHWREVESMLTHLGARVEPHHGASFRVVLNGVEGFLHRPHNSNTCTKQELRHVRDYLASAGVTLSQLEAGEP
jgi:hypothetical protein